MQRNDGARPATALLVVSFLLGACSGAESTDPAEPASDVSSVEPVDEPATTTKDTAEVDERVADDTDPPADTPSTLPAPPTTLPREMFSAVSVDPDTGEVTEIELAEAGPTTYAGVVDAGIAAGIWNEIEGLTRVLDYAVGALPAEQVPGVDDVISGELTEVLHRAWRLNASGEYTPDALEPLRRRYVLFAPPEDVLDELAADATEVPAVQGFRGVAAAPACAPIAVDDFDSTAWIEGCYQVLQTTLPDATLRVFYPGWYDDDGSLTNLPPITLDALVRSVETYRSLGRVGDIDVVFSAADTIENVDNDGDFYALATASAVKPWDNDVTDRCAITTWPYATSDPTAFQQTIAHEAWHCIQYYDGMDYSGGAQNWWVEGGAEFFSNVAYPSADDEHVRLGTFDDGLQTPLYEMAYEVWPWWQHLSNEFSPLFVADLNREMMSTAGSGVELLSGYEETFHDFVADYVAGKVIDQSGAPIARARRFVNFPVVKKGEEARQLKWTLQNWAPLRFHISYDKELRILQSDSSSGGLRSMVKWEQRSDRPSWKGIFPEVRSKCRERGRYAGVITDATADASTPVELKIVIDEIEEASCDPCVLGTWSLDLNTFEEMIVGAMASEGGQMPPGTSFEIGGAYYTALNEEDQVLEQRDGLAITASVAGVGGFTTTINSFAEGTYSADGERMTVSSLVESFNEVTTNLPGGGSYSFPSATQAGTGTYTCNEEQMIVTIESYPPVTWNRVDKILTPPNAPTDPTTADPEP
jgi:hypothetical protein